MNAVFVDAMVFIYALQGHETYGVRARAFAAAADAKRWRVVTSSVVAAEVLTGALRTGDEALIAATRAALTAPGIEILTFGAGDVEVCAKVRSEHRVAMADAINFACASRARTWLFLTHDKRLRGKNPAGVEIVADLDADIW
jgi:predicted nucleic acid-binding protein